MAITTTDPKNEIKRLSAALAKVGVTLPEAVTTAPERVRVEAPTSREIGEAIRAAKDPLTDKHVAQLMLAHQIAKGGFESDVMQAGWADQRQALKDVRADLNDALHDVFDRAAEELTEVAPKLGGYEDLDSLVLANLPARVVEPTRRATEAQAVLRNTVDAWKTLWAVTASQNLGPGVSNVHVLAVTDPAPGQWLEHASRRPHTLPDPGDYLAMVRMDWGLSLAESPRAAKDRNTNIRETLERDRALRTHEKGKATQWGTIGAARIR